MNEGDMKIESLDNLIISLTQRIEDDEGYLKNYIILIITFVAIYLITTLSYILFYLNELRSPTILQFLPLLSFSILIITVLFSLSSAHKRHLISRNHFMAEYLNVSHLLIAKQLGEEKTKKNKNSNQLIEVLLNVERNHLVKHGMRDDQKSIPNNLMGKAELLEILQSHFNQE